MAVFQYSGRNRKGERVKGTVKADTRSKAVQKLKENGIAVAALEEMTGLLYREVNILPKKVKYKDLVIYIRQFATLIKAGISVVEATKILSEQTDNRLLKDALVEVEEEIRSGIAYSEAARKFPNIFPSIYINMVKAGEVGGQLDEILDRLATYFEKQYEIRQKVKSAMVYPLAILFVAIMVVFFMFIYVVPMFEEMFASLGANLPLITRLMLMISHVLTSYGWLIVLIVMACSLLFWLWMRSPRGNYLLDYMKLKIPVFGKIIQKSALARMARTLSSLFSASVPILDSLTIVERIVDNQVIINVLNQSKESLEEGKSMAEPMIGHWAFPPFVTRMIILGESSGTLDFMLEKVADFYESEVEQATEQVKTLIEPMLIVFLAVAVGIIILSIYVPIFRIYQGF
ncbi:MULTISPECIES: type II secretion system F family protein [Bacillus]|uniref:type II secretion system F family protein n=1 Tax=Bacillus TaxID=1386 RepID=UPI00065DE62F|nr:type II secretion system F family protein [Bacillus smithii]AKP48266.1 Type IV fimbrial assembly protein PilC [Bacillus smithii]